MWTETWPTEPGLYWFYGWTSEFVKNYGREPKLSFVRVMRGAGTNIIRITEGAFLYKEEGAIGFFKPLDPPELPDLSTLGK